MKKVIIALVVVLALTMLASCSMDNFEIENVTKKFDELVAIKKADDLSTPLAALADNLVKVESLATSNTAGSKVGATYDVYKLTEHVVGKGGGLNLALKNGGISKISHADMYTYYFSPYRVDLILVYGE